MKLQILHTNDLHDRLPEEALQNAKKPGGLLLDSGDAIGGSNLVFRKTEPNLEKMGRLGYHAMAMGNREFHYSRKILAGRLAAASFPILSANVVDLWKRLKMTGSLIFEVDELRIGVFGLTVPQYPIGSVWETITGWRFFDPLPVVEEIPGRLRRQGAHLVFCLSHLGFRWDQRLAESSEEIDVILGGHSHTILPKVFRAGKTAIVQAGAYGRFIGNWELDVALEKGSVRSWTLEGGLVETKDV